MNQLATTHSQLEVIDRSSLETMERVQLDVQITTAKHYPRTLSTVKKSMMEFATLDEETAASCFYTLPRKSQDGGSKNIQGPGVRLAEIALSCFGNIRAAARIVSNDGKSVTAQGVCHDLQNNVSVSVEVKRRITDKNGRTYSDDMVIVTGNAACAIALRNAVFKVVPGALVHPVYEAAKRVAVGDATTLVQRRIKCIEAFGKMGVTKEKLLAKLERKAAEDITLDDLETLIGLHTSLKDGNTTIDEVFAPTTTMPVVNVVPKSDAEGLQAAQEQVEAFVDKKNAEVQTAKAKARAKKEPEPEPTETTPEPPASNAPSDRDRFAIMLEEAGYNERQALKALRAMTLIGNDIVALKDVDYATILEVLKSWEVVFIPTLAKLFPA